MAGKRKWRRRKEFQREIASGRQQVGAGATVARPGTSALPTGARSNTDPTATTANATPVAEPPATPAAPHPAPAAATPPESERAPVLRVWRHWNFSMLVGGSVPHHITSWMQRVGIGWLAWELTHSYYWVGVIAAADFAPMIFLAPFAGAACDRFSMMAMMRISNILMLVQAAALAFLTGIGVMSIELLLALSIFSGVVHPFVSASRHTIVPLLVPRTDFAAAVALDSAIFQASRFVGPAIAAIMIPFTGVNGTFIAHVVGLAIMIVALYLMRVDESAKHSHHRRNMLYDVIDSVMYARRHVGIFPVFVLLTIMSVLLRPIQDMLPGFAGGVFGAEATGLAWLTSAVGIGAMCSAGWIAIRGRVEGLTTVMLLGALALVVATIGFVATPTLWVGLVFAACSGFGLNVMSTSIQSLVQTAVSDEMRGRVMSLYILIFRGTPAIGAVFLGLLADHVGLRIAFGCAAVLAFACWLWVAPQQKRMAEALELTGPAPSSPR